MDIKRILTTLDALNEGTMQSATKKPTGPKFVGKWKGTDPASAAKNKLVGASESMLKDLERKLDETPVRDIMAEFKLFKQQVNEFAPSDDNSGEEDGLHKYARMWFNGDNATQQQVEKVLDGMGWEIGQDEGYDDEPGVFVVRAGDVNGDSYINWAPEDLRETLDEVAMNPKAFAQAVAAGQEKGVLVGFEFETCIPKRTVEQWKSGGQPSEVPQYNPEDTSWADDKTAGDIITGIKRAGKGFQQTFEHLFKYKTSVKDQVGKKDPWSHYRSWASAKADQHMEGQNTVTATFNALSEMLKDPEVAAMEIRYGSQAEEKFGPPDRWNGRTFTIALLKDQTGVDFGKRVPKAQLTPELSDKVREAMRWAYRMTFGPYDYRTNAVSDAVSNMRTQFLANYVPGNSYNVETTAEHVAASAQHFNEFCQETMGTDNLKELLKKKWAFKGRVNNTSDTLREQLWYFVTPNAPLPSSMGHRNHRTEYKEGAEFLKANLTDVYGDNITIFTGYHQAAKQLDRWYIEPDGSLRPDSGDYSAEVVSPPLPAAEAMSALKTWYQKAQSLNLYTNSSTGLHINVSIPGELDVLKLAVFAGDQFVLKQFGRENNSYARSVIKSLQGNGNVPQLGSKEFKDAEKEMQELVKRISGDHFATVNFNGKYVSFRHAGGDYLNKMTDIVNTVGRFIRSMVIAADSSAYRQEYVSKLVKFMKAPAEAGEKLALTDLRQYAEKGIPVINLDVIIAPTPDGNGFDVSTALATLKNTIADNLNGRGLVVIEPDPLARQRLLDSSGFATSTKEWMQVAPDSMFYRAVVYPNNRNTLTRFESDYADYGNNRGSATSSKTNGQKSAVFVKYRSLIKANDTHFAEAVKALRGGMAKPIPLPGSKAAPKPQVQQTQPTQQTAQQPAPAQEPRGDSNAQSAWTLNNGAIVRHYDPSQVNSERAYELARELYTRSNRPVTISRDGVEYGRWPRENETPVSESRIFDPKSKVNVVYSPQNGMKRIILARAVDHAMAERVIKTYVHKSQMDPSRLPVRAQDFVMQPVKYDYTNEAQQFDSKQEVIDHFVKQGKSAAAGAAAWERGWRGTQAKPTNMNNFKFKKPPTKSWQELDEYGGVGGYGAASQAPQGTSNANPDPATLQKAADATQIQKNTNTIAPTLNAQGAATQINKAKFQDVMNKLDDRSNQELQGADLKQLQPLAVAASKALQNPQTAGQLKQVIAKADQADQKKDAQVKQAQQQVGTNKPADQQTPQSPTPPGAKPVGTP